MQVYNTLLKKDLEHIVNHSRALLESMKGKSVFVTGGTGYFGKWILETFAYCNDTLSLNTKVVILTRDVSRFRETNQYFFGNKLFSFIEGDINTFAFPDEKFDFIIHAATDSDSVKYKTSPLLMFNTIVEGTRRALDFAVQCGANDFLYISSGAVYGKQPLEVSQIPEEFTGGPGIDITDSAYSEGKRAAEMLCTLYSSKYGFQIKIARCFAFVGPYLPLDKHFAIGNFIHDCLENRPIIIKGDGTPLRSYLYSADLVIWLIKILVEGKNCRPYNVGSEDAISISDLAKTIATISDKVLEIKVLTKGNDLSNTEKYIPSTKRARTELGLKQLIDIQDSIRRTLNYHKCVNEKYFV
jgi:nucleoside-diphosphate-sugar epimerase